MGGKKVAVKDWTRGGDGAKKGEPGSPRDSTVFWSFFLSLFYFIYRCFILPVIFFFLERNFFRNC